MTSLTRRSFVSASMLAAGATLTGAAGDGQTDDTAALREAAAKGGVLELPPGAYRITATIVLDTAKTGYTGVRGAQGTARIVMAGPGPAILVLGDHQGTAAPQTVQEHTWESERFPILSGFEIVGDHPEADGIELRCTMECVIESVAIRKCRYGIHLVERNRNPIIAHCQIYDCLDSGIFMDACNLHQFNIIGNHISYCARAGIRQLNGDVHNVQITGNDIEYNAGVEDASSGEILLEVPNDGAISEYVIASNTIQARPEQLGANILIAGRQGEDSVGLIAVTGNVLGSRNKNIHICDARDPVTILGNTIYTGKILNIHLQRCANAAVNGNTITSSSLPEFADANGIMLEDCSACMMDGNIVRINQGGSEERGGDIALLRCRDIAVSACQIHTPRYRGLYLEDCARCRIANNSIIAGENAPMLAAITLAGACKGNMILHNALPAGAKGTIEGETGASALDGNIALED